MSRNTLLLCLITLTGGLLFGCGSSTTGSGSDPDAVADSTDLTGDVGDATGDAYTYPGPPVYGEASVNPAIIVAGGSATVTCKYLDAQGKTAKPSPVVLVPEELLLEDMTVSGTVAGSFDITCSIKNAPASFKAKKATLTVQAGEIVSFKAGVKPKKEKYGAGMTVTITHDMADKYGNPVQEVAIKPITVDPADAVELKKAPDRFVLMKEARIKFTVDTEDGKWSDTVDLLCDATGPFIDLVSPVRGATVIPKELDVSGSITDAVLKVVSSTFDGQPLVLDAEGKFMFGMQVEPEMTVLHFQASDELGTTSERYNAVFRSYAFSKPAWEKPGAALVRRSVRASISQDFLDDGQRENPPDDLAGILEVLIGNMDVAALLPASEFQVTTALKLIIGEVVFGQPSMMMVSSDAGISFGMAIPELQMSVILQSCTVYPNETVCNDYDGYISADAVEVGAMLTPGISESGGLTLTVSEVEINLVNPQIVIAQIQGNLLNQILGKFLLMFKDKMAALVQPVLNDQIAKMLASADKLFQEGMMIPLPALPGLAAGQTLRIIPSIESLSTSDAGLDLQLALEACMPELPPGQNLGSIIRDTCGLALPALPEDQVNLSLAVDFANQALWALWNGSALKLRLDETALAAVDLSKFGISGLSLDLDFVYPPYVSGCKQSGSLRLQIGDLFMHAKFKLLGSQWEFSAYVYTELGLGLALESREDGTYIVVQIEDPSMLELEVFEVNDTLKGKEAQVINLIKNQLLPMVLGMVKDTPPAFKLPSLDLGTLLGLGVPMMIDVVPSTLEIKAGLVQAGLKTAP